MHLGWGVFILSRQETFYSERGCGSPTFSDCIDASVVLVKDIPCSREQLQVFNKKTASAVFQVYAQAVYFRRLSAVFLL